MLQKHRPMQKGIAVLALATLSLALLPVYSPAQESRIALVHPAPVYPEMAKKYGVRGIVKVQLLIAPDGHVKETKIIGGHPMLAAAVEDTVKTWKYAPASSESRVVLDFNFHP